MRNPMTTEAVLPMNSFAADVDSGLRSLPKKLSSRYFYDAEGDKLFQQIMQLDEYYLTRTEYAILEKSKELLAGRFQSLGTPFHLIEFGAGDGWKTKVLLRHFVSKGVDFDYRPIDISGNVLEGLAASLSHEIPDLEVHSMEGEYFDVLGQMSRTDSRGKVVLFLGSNVGNFRQPQAVDFLSQLRNALNPGDLALIGFDMKKDPRTIRSAYDDASGVTAAFNLNLLHRINRELGANFNLGDFKHYQSYNPVSGECCSFLISQKEQSVCVEATQTTYHFERWEPIHVEISRKFDQKTINGLAEASGFEVVENLTDHDRYFTDSLWVAS